MTDVIIPLIWLVTLTIGLVVTVINLTGSIEDRRHVHRYWPNHIARKRVADGSVRNQAIILGIIVLFIMAGVIGLTFPRPRTDIPALLVYSGLIGGIALLVLLSILERRDRRRLMEG